MTMDTAELLSNPTNYAVVQLPGRKFPGVVMQGDSLNSLTKRLERMRSDLRIDDFDRDKVAAELDDLVNLFSEVRSHYEKVCAAKGLTLPYPK
jgi:hypothetical protein